MAPNHTKWCTLNDCLIYHNINIVNGGEGVYGEGDVYWISMWFYIFCQSFFLWNLVCDGQKNTNSQSVYHMVVWEIEKNIT